MGVDICYCIDHDLPTDSLQSFYEEFKIRINDSEVILHNCSELPVRDVICKKNTWYILYTDEYSDFCLHYEKDNYSFHLEIYKKLVDVKNIDYINKKKIIR